MSTPSALTSAMSRTRRAYGRARDWILDTVYPSAAGLLLFAPVLLIAVGAAAPDGPSLGPVVNDAGVQRLAAVSNNRSDLSGAVVIPVSRPPTSFHIAAAAVSAPPPPVIVTAPGALRIPQMALKAYRNAEAMMASAAPTCGVSWNLLAGIGRIESMHANGGATDARGVPVAPIYGPTLDGTLPGNEIITAGAVNGRTTYARALGPMQFLPGTWAKYASDGDNDGKADVQNLFDASLGAARYLCSGGLNLRDPSQVMSAILRYNNSTAYARNVLGWAASYATGVAPIDLPPITGPVPPLADAHVEARYEGLGPGLPGTTLGLSPTDPLTQLPVIDFGRNEANPLTPLPAQPVGPSGVPAQQGPSHGTSCVVFCIGSTTVPPQTGSTVPAPTGGTPPAPSGGLPIIPTPEAPPPAPQFPWLAPPPPSPEPAPPSLGPAPGPAPGPPPGPTG